MRYKLTSSEHDHEAFSNSRDSEDAVKFSQWLSEHNPFPKIDVIMSIDLQLWEDVKPEGSQYKVVDGGHLLSYLVRQQEATFGTTIADRYVPILE
ncbi:hypothetical protein AVEN_30588-1 [Araneus ventricosus]|uniref:Uncharacterized protein n=1 Tax=Araneus ventricosus TaxID=182803 RepID=A0A4Y2EQG6_ARAVE|nr:hypothetical protein AVEN_30588-1 [Araneus ventricosus]